MPTYAQPLVPGPVKQTRILLPEHISYRKIIAYKIRLRKGEPWLGDVLRVPYNLNIQEAEMDGMSVLKHIHLKLTGLLERKYGAWIWQESDQMQSTTYVEEWPESEYNDRRWAVFVRQEP